ncbi:MAG TPA: hypothetical protein VGO56_03780 [Pyrinomonadaceae bacterium]|jgi:hypothetical protein|nr:hypothetical protein [Pyrinomonadaceae bacterium]
MKSYLFRSSSILFAFALLVSLSLSGTAQQSPRQQQQLQVQQQEERPQPELAVQQIDAEALRIIVPPACKGLVPVVQIHNSGPGNPSAALLAFMGGHVRKGYNNPAVNTYFGDTFKIKSCRICYATIEANVEHYGDSWSNDSLTVGAAPFGPGNRFVSAYIWPPNTNPKTFTWVLNAALMNTYLMSGSQPPTDVDAYAQDDTNFHSLKLSVWYY